MSSYLITGGAGFIGSHLADRLINEGHRVTIIDDLSSGKLANLNKKCDFIEGTIADSVLLKKAFEGVDFCYHMAAIASVQKSIDDWMGSHHINLDGSIQVFLEASNRKVPVVYASSAAVYGDPATLPVTEIMPAKPTSPYGLDKYCCELQAKLFGQIHGLKNIGLRFFNVYGARQDPNSPYSGVISIFMNRLNNNQDLNVFGDGTQERDFVFVGDIVKALIAAQSFVSEESKTYNVCTGTGLSINQLIEIMFEAFGKRLPINYLPAKNGDIYKSIGDNAKITQEIGCEIQTKLEPNLLKSIIY